MLEIRSEWDGPSGMRDERQTLRKFLAGTVLRTSISCFDNGSSLFFRGRKKKNISTSCRMYLISAALNGPLLGRDNTTRLRSHPECGRGEASSVPFGTRCGEKQTRRAYHHCTYAALRTTTLLDSQRK